MDLSGDDNQPVILLNDAENYSGLYGCKLIALTQAEAEKVADNGRLILLPTERTFDLEDVVRFAFAKGYLNGQELKGP